MTIVVLGATGYTGRLVVAELVRLGERPVVAGRSRERLVRLAAEHGGLETAVADAQRPDSMAVLTGPGDVMVTTVGPFVMLGEPALQAALRSGAAYVDSTGEAAFVRRVFSAAEQAPATFLTASGYDFVPGQLAGALALADAPAAASLDIVYTGEVAAGTSSGTAATGRLVFEQPTHARSGGRLEELTPMRTVQTFQDGNRQITASLFGGTEPYAFPQVPQCRVFLDLGPTARLAQRASYVVPQLLRVPAVGGLLRSVLRRGAATTGQGPGPEQRAASRCVVLGIARDAAGAELARVRLAGPDPYDITASLMAWAAVGLSAGGTPAGGQTPLTAFGLEPLRVACEAAGLRRLSM